MKNSIIIITFIALFTSCGKGPTPQPTEPQLPPITNVGANTFGCKVNGVVAQTKGGLGFLSAEGVEFSYNSIHKELSILAITLNPKKTFNIRIKLTNYLIGTHNANEFDSFGQTSSLGLARANDRLPAIVTISKSQINILNSATPGDILSGTFNIDLAYGTTIYHLTEGRFDIKYK
jgi:hypothetical protein